MLTIIYDFSRVFIEKVRNFALDCRAGSMALVGFATVPVVAFIGISGDTTVGYLVKSRLTAAVDSAGLAAAREVDADLRDADLAMFFDANFPQDYLGATIDGPHLTVSDDGYRLEITASASVPTNFMRVIGIDAVTVNARTVIERARSGMELVLVMDNTGSMCCDDNSGSKIVAMKTAAQSLIDILFGDDEQIENFWVGLVPYTSMVNIGDVTLNRQLWLNS